MHYNKECKVGWKRQSVLVVIIRNALCVKEESFDVREMSHKHGTLAACGGSRELAWGREGGASYELYYRGTSPIYNRGKRRNKR